MCSIPELCYVMFVKFVTFLYILFLCFIGPLQPGSIHQSLAFGCLVMNVEANSIKFWYIYLHLVDLLG